MFWALLACAAPAPHPDVLLVSMDTTRADVITPEVAPNLTALGARGATFDWALSHVPTTLSSHATVFTGLDPHGHRIPRNGFPLRGDVPTLAELMNRSGYDTIGVVGASILGHDMGISRGFRVWDERFSADKGRRQERRAEEVTAAALAAIEAREPGKPLFCFVHYFDAHAPYEAPEPYGHRFADPAYAGPLVPTPEAMDQLGAAMREGHPDPADVAQLHALYEGEVAYVDAQLPTLLAALHDPLVIVFSDHGEALGEDRVNPLGHGGDVDLYAIHVPLVIAGPGVEPREVQRQVRLSDLGSTILDLSGVGGTLGNGEDLRPLLRGRSPTAPPHFAEATQPILRTFPGRWNNLGVERGVAEGGQLLIRDPMSGTGDTLFQLDAAQTRLHDGARIVELGALLAGWDRDAPAFVPRTMSETTREQLEALGYTEK